MKARPSLRVVLIVVLFLAASGYWVHLAAAAKYTSTHQVSSTSQLASFGDFIQGTVSVLIFAGCGFTLWYRRGVIRQRKHTTFIRILIGSLALAGIAFAWLLFSEGYPSPRISGTRPVPLFIGAFLLMGYFATALFAVLPFGLAQRVQRFRFLLHFGDFPTALGAIFLLGYPPDYYATFDIFGMFLAAGLPSVLLNFWLPEAEAAGHPHTTYTE